MVSKRICQTFILFQESLISQPGPLPLPHVQTQEKQAKVKVEEKSKQKVEKPADSQDIQVKDSSWFSSCQTLRRK